MKKFIITENEKRNILEMYGFIKEQISETPVCSKTGCKGTYKGPEFEANGNDIAHDYSNVMTKAVATKLKELYRNGDYVKVNFDGIQLTTKGMKKNSKEMKKNSDGSQGYVEYTIDIPFESVSDKCDARTGFGHVGGWRHPSAGVDVRKNELFNDTTKNGVRTNPVVGTINDMESSKKTSTPEGLIEYWIQWKHSSLQSECGKQKENNTTNSNTDIDSQTKKSKKNKKIISYSNRNPNDLRTKLINFSQETELYNVNLSINKDDQNVIIEYDTQGDERTRLSYIFSNSGEENKVLEKVKEKNNVVDKLPLNFQGFSGWVIKITEK